MDYNTFMMDINDKPICFQSYCFLLNFVEQHNVSLIENIHIPKIENIQNILICANHSLKQLNIIKQNNDNINNYELNSVNEKNNKIDSVLTLLNICKTKMGKRHLSNILLNPSCNYNKIKEDYDNIELLMKKDLNFTESLMKIKDIEQKLTKMKLYKITPLDIYYLYDTHKIMEKIYNKHKKNKQLNKIFNIDNVLLKFKDFKTDIEQKLDIKVCAEINNLSFDKYENNHLLIRKGNFEDLDNLIQTKMESENKLQSIANFIESLFEKKDKSNFLKFHEPTSSEMSILLTKKRSLLLKKEISRLKSGNLNLSFISSFNAEEKSFNFNIDSIDFVEYNKTTNIIKSSDINELISNIYNNNLIYNDLLQKSYKQIVEDIYINYFDHLLLLIDSIKTIDILNTKVQLSIKFNLCKPEIKNKENSYVNAKKMRHILIENIDKNEIYIPNDIELNNNNLGILLYGTNAVGKTSLIKALGICIIMAQSGFYVPCESFEYSPYKYIFTRIIGNDNLFRGLSTFGVEMSELRVILNQCNNNSLILGDELCSGTEIDSALSIFTASLEVMTKNKSNFIFATHFHELQTMKEIKDIQNINCKHLKVKYNNETQQLIYDRTLHDGQGDTIYGLEVCKSLKINEDFINRCYEIRNNLIGNKNNVLSLKISKYNNKKIKNVCEFCNKNMGTEIHHLQYQKNANKNDYIDNSFHKNHNANLASICENCHDHIHSLNLVYERKKTINGDYELILKKN